MEKSRLVQITRRKAIEEDEFLHFANRLYERIWGNLLPPQILTHDLSNTIKNNIITPEDAPVPDCLTCGACCGSLICVGLSPGNPISSNDYWDITREGKNGPFTVDRFIRRNEEDFSCTALEGTIGEMVGCRLYQERPSMCRNFEAGSDRCHALRRAYGLEPFLSLEEMSAALDKISEREKKNAPDKINEVRIREDDETELLRIIVTLNDGSTRVLHRFDPKRESWFQFEFEGKELSKAKELVASRTKKG
ncbi:MAG: YkgJ family cysteine cluster protein [Pyrinomonadaceae bacterium]